MSYSRHAVHDDHLHSGSNPLVNFKVWLLGCLLSYLLVDLFVYCSQAHMNVRRLMSDNSRNVRRRNKGPHGNKVANGQPGPANGGAMVRPN